MSNESLKSNCSSVNNTYLFTIPSNRFLVFIFFSISLIKSLISFLVDITPSISLVYSISSINDFLIY